MNLQPDAMTAHQKQIHRDMGTYSGRCECCDRLIFGRVAWWGEESVLIQLGGDRHRILRANLTRKN